jgi:hypothetical protein
VGRIRLRKRARVEAIYSDSCNLEAVARFVGGNAHVRRRKVIWDNEPVPQKFWIVRFSGNRRVSWSFMLDDVFRATFRPVKPRKAEG